MTEKTDFDAWAGDIPVVRKRAAEPTPGYVQDAFGNYYESDETFLTRALNRKFQKVTELTLKRSEA